MTRLDVVMAQINPLVGDVDGNVTMVVEHCQRALAGGPAQLLVFPELTLSGYPPQDLLLRSDLDARIECALQRLCRELPPQLRVVVGYPRRREGVLLNAAGLIQAGKLLAECAKIELGDSRDFDERRYFAAGDAPCVLEMEGFRIALSVGSAGASGRSIRLAREAGAEVVLHLGASAFCVDLQERRREELQRRAAQAGVCLVDVNLVGGQDELVFDGGSMAAGPDGRLAVRAPFFEPVLQRLRVVRDGAGRAVFEPGEVGAEMDRHAAVYAALVTGVRDYVRKNGFRSALLGLSGGIDSALTLAIAVDALGPEHVAAVMMPFRYTAPISIEDAAAQARTQGVRFRVMPIAPMVEAFIGALVDEHEADASGTMEQNIQARCRAVLLMALSNRDGSLVLTTSNKSEVAVGYSTLYGDMAGGLDVLKDVPKTLVFELARFRNRRAVVIPPRVIERPPSAELAPGQLDADSLPPYEVLDAILECHVGRDMSSADIIRRGFDPETVRWVARMVDRNEYKRRQAPLGIRISDRAFDGSRRYPVTSGWKWV